jgi:hypothetical protein
MKSGKQFLYSLIWNESPLASKLFQANAADREVFLYKVCVYLVIFSTGFFSSSFFPNRSDHHK